MTEATLTRATPLRHSPPLDGLRGVFVLLILLVHSAYFNFESLAVTVDGFFVTSGFLITTLLLEEHRHTQHQVLLCSPRLSAVPLDVHRHRDNAAPRTRVCLR